MNRYLIGFSALLALTACGGSDAAPTTKPKSSTSTSQPAKADAPEAGSSKAAADTGAKKSGDKQDWAASMGTATVSGSVKFEGTVPERAGIDTAADAVCSGSLLTEEVIVNNGGLSNVIISVSKGLTGYKFAKGTGQVTLNQVGCQYTPHVIAMQAGQELSIENSDDTVHNVHSYSKRNPVFNSAQPAGAPALVKPMKQKDKTFDIKCDMHAWMNCQVAVFDHPFFIVSDADGNFTLPKLAAGSYTLTAEHESLGKQTAEVTVADSGAETVTFSFEE
ncbi:MAG: plastocyanin [Planctomycetota bacterium]|jgi:plastocyanin